MPKDEFDFDDPLELNGVALCTEEDTSRDMAECFIEEFLMMGHSPGQLLALFRNPHYLGMNLVLQNKGEPFVKGVISDVFARWGRKIEWPAASAGRGREEPGSPSTAAPAAGQGLTPAGTNEFEVKTTDPLGHPAPQLNL